MEPIAGEIKEFLGTLGFIKRLTLVEIEYDHTKPRMMAYIKIEGPIDPSLREAKDDGSLDNKDEEK